MATVCNCHGMLFLDCPNIKRSMAMAKGEWGEPKLEKVARLVIAMAGRYDSEKAIGDLLQRLVRVRVAEVRLEEFDYIRAQEPPNSGLYWDEQYRARLQRDLAEARRKLRADCVAAAKSEDRARARGEGHEGEYEILLRTIDLIDEREREKEGGK